VQVSEPTRSSSGIRTKEVVVVPHTHWDREWYRTFQAFRMRLVDAVDRVIDLLEAATLPHFLLDGQTVMIEDYLAIRPEQRDRLAALVRSGQLAIGPWYILPDEFLVSGESLIRNLLFGRRLMQQFGGQSTIGYLPDMFGHVAQMPQVLRGFGMERALVWRGVDPDSELFWWRDPSGERIATTFLPTGYCNVFLWDSLPLETRVERFHEFLKVHRHDRILLLSGCDHLAPNHDLPQIIRDLQGQWTDGTIHLGRLVDAFEGSPETEVSGELRQGGRAYLLPDVLSARMYLKQANAACQTLWERYVEPLTALVGYQGGPYADGYWHEGWQKILLNQPHDSICGCSVDEVHREMLARFSESMELGEGLIERSLLALAPKSEAPGAIAFNPHPQSRSQWAEVVIDWPRDGAPESAHLVTESGETVPCRLVSTEDTEAFYAEIDLFPGWREVRRFRFSAYLASVPALGVRRLFARPGAPEALNEGVSVGPNSLSNEHLRLFIKDGALHLEDNDTGAHYPDVHSFEDGADAGDEYNYSPPADDRLVTSEIDHWSVDHHDETEAVLRVVYRLTLPERLNQDRTGRSNRTVQEIVTSRFRLRAGSRVVAVETEVDNRACDHRLRVRFGTGLIDPDVRAFSENQFWVAERPVTPPQTTLPVAPLAEYEPTTFPQQTWSAVAGPYGLMVANHGLPEAEVSRDAGGDWALKLTLLRCVGWLSRDDLRTRGGGAGPHVQTPDAQCLGTHTFSYALIPFRDGWTTAQPLAQGFVAPFRVLSVGGGQASRAGGLELPDWLGLGDDRLVLSALKCQEGGRGLTLRVYNPTERPIETDLTVALPHRAISLASMAEEPRRDLGQGRLDLVVGSGEIVTLVISP